MSRKGSLPTDDVMRWIVAILADSGHPIDEEEIRNVVRSRCGRPISQRRLERIVYACLIALQRTREVKLVPETRTWESSSELQESLGSIDETYPIPTTDRLLVPVMRFLRGLTEGADLDSIVLGLERLFPVDEERWRSALRDGIREALRILKRCGLVEGGPGYLWTATEEGRNASDEAVSDTWVTELRRSVLRSLSMPVSPYAGA